MKASLTVIFLALLLDILAFTVILPLLPRILSHYATHDGKDPLSFFSRVLALLQRIIPFNDHAHRFDIVLMGGILFLFIS